MKLYLRNLTNTVKRVVLRIALGCPAIAAALRLGRRQRAGTPAGAY
jgi:hypothetical protein